MQVDWVYVVVFFLLSVIAYNARQTRKAVEWMAYPERREEFQEFEKAKWWLVTRVALIVFGVVYGLNLLWNLRLV